ETWVYDAVADQWEQKFPSIKPSARLRHGMAYDPISKRTLMFGGNAGGTLSGETWAYDLLNNKWTDLFPGRRPAERTFSEMAYASKHGLAVLFGGDYTLGLNDTWHLLPGTPWNGNVVDPAKYTNGENFTAVTWNNAGTDAFFVGHNSTHAVLYTYYHGSDYIAIVPGTGDVFAGHELYAATCKPKTRTGELAILGASSFKVMPMMFDSSTMLTVNVDFPHIFDIDFREQSTGLSMVYQQVDVNKNYTFFIEGNYTIGGVDMWNAVNITIDAWFDEGRVGTGSAPEGSWSTEYNRTRQFRITRYSGVTTLDYPSAPEFILQDTWADPTTYAGGRHRIYINITFGNQTRAAGGALTPPAMDDIWNITRAFNNSNSWDFKVRLEDHTYTDAFAEAYGEFGVKKNVAISVTGNPSGSAPPGTENKLMDVNSRITYSANTAYWVNVSIPHLTGPAGQIGAGNVSVRNIHLAANATNSYIPAQTNFPAAPDTEMNIWGRNATYAAAPCNGSVSAGPWVTNFNSGGLGPGYEAYTELQWWVTVMASVSEGVYTAQITVTIRS
ncbi:MAG: kelch repeat-containing protein, partial [Thermoplasmata archaeon]